MLHLLLMIMVGCAFKPTIPLSASPIVVVDSVKKGDLKQNKYAAVRIPVAVRANNGNLVLIYQGRESEDDRSNDHLLAAVSKDEGRTFKHAVLFDKEGVDLGDNSVVIDKVSGRIFAFAYSEGAQYIFISENNGVSWKQLQHELIVDPDGNPARMRGTTGIQLDDKQRTMVVPVILGKGYLGYMTCPAKGKQWEISVVDKAKNKWNEPAIIQIKNRKDIKILTITRLQKGDERKFKSHSYAKVNENNGEISLISENEVKPFSLKSTHCNQHFIHYDPKTIVYGSPIQKRMGGELFFSTDSGKNWKSKIIVPPKKMFAYCSLVILSDGSLGVFYETKGKTGNRYSAIEFIKLDHTELF